MSQPDESPGDVETKLETISEIADSADANLKTAVPWKQDPSQLPAGSQRALDENIELSKACEGVTGTSIDPRTGDVVPSHNLCMRYLAQRRRMSDTNTD